MRVNLNLPIPERRESLGVLRDTKDEVLLRDVLAPWVEAVRERHEYELAEWDRSREYTVYMPRQFQRYRPFKPPEVPRLVEELAEAYVRDGRPDSGQYGETTWEGAVRLGRRVVWWASTDSADRVAAVLAVFAMSDGPGEGTLNVLAMMAGDPVVQAVP